MQKQHWNRHTILAALRERHMTLRGLKEKYGLSVSSVANIWSRPHEPAERAIADFLNQPVETLFPDRYPKTRNRILRRSYPANSEQNKPSKAA